MELNFFKIWALTANSQVTPLSSRASEHSHNLEDLEDLSENGLQRLIFQHTLMQANKGQKGKSYTDFKLH